MRSSEWRKRAHQVRERADHRCENCGAKDVPLDVHHWTYKRLGNEAAEDLSALCSECHRIADANRVSQWSSRRDSVRELLDDIYADYVD